MKLNHIVIATGVALFCATGAQALPVSPLSAISADSAPVVQVRGGCGFGEHRGPMGGCRLNRGPRGDIRRAITGAPRGCPPGMHRGPRGFCHR
jgi:hypothetical protein